MAVAFKPYVSPSTVLINASGEGNFANSSTEIAANPHHPVGLKEGEFAPLPANLRVEHANLVLRFAQRYEAYKKEIVSPWIRAFCSCHALIALVDVTMLLEGGAGMYDDNRQLLIDLLQVVNPGQNLLGKFIRGFGLNPGGVTRIAFVATKLDKVHDLDRDAMVSLLRDMISHPVHSFDGLHVLYSNCSAVVSATPLPNSNGQDSNEERWLSGVPQFDASGNKRRIAHEELENQPEKYLEKFLVSKLPDGWPRYWRPGDYRFPDVYPQMPFCRHHPPNQINLDKILEFVLR